MVCEWRQTHHFVSWCDSNPVAHVCHQCRLRICGLCTSTHSYFVTRTPSARGFAVHSTSCGTATITARSVGVKAHEPCSHSPSTTMWRTRGLVSVGTALITVVGLLFGLLWRQWTDSCLYPAYISEGYQGFNRHRHHVGQFPHLVRALRHLAGH